MVSRRALVVVAAAALPALAVATAPVAAEEMADFDAAVLSGTASAPGVLLVGGPPGIFTFNSSLCVMASASGPGGDAGEPSPDVEVVPDSSCSATATGSYINDVCGTGLVFGTGSLSEGASSDTYTVTEFSIMFVSGVGVLSGVVTESDADGGGTAGAQPLYGTVLLEPQVLVDPSHCADQFTAYVALETTA